MGRRRARADSPGIGRSSAPSSARSSAMQRDAAGMPRRPPRESGQRPRGGDWGRTERPRRARPGPTLRIPSPLAFGEERGEGQGRAAGGRAGLDGAGYGGQCPRGGEGSAGRGAGAGPLTSGHRKNGEGVGGRAGAIWASSSDPQPTEPRGRRSARAAPWGDPPRPEPSEAGPASFASGPDARAAPCPAGGDSCDARYRCGAARFGRAGTRPGSPSPG